MQKKTFFSFSFYSVALSYKMVLQIRNRNGALSSSHLPYSLFRWHGNWSGVSSWRMSQFTYCTVRLLGGEKRGKSKNTPDHPSQMFFYQSDTPLYWESVSEWTMQLIGLLCHLITTTLQFYTGTNDRTNLLIAKFR